MYVRSILKVCPACGDLTILRLTEGQEDFTPNAQSLLDTGICPHCRGEEEEDNMLCVTGVDNVTKLLESLSDEEAYTMWRGMLYASNRLKDMLSLSLIALNLLGLEDACYVDDENTVRPRHPKETVEGFSHILIHPEDGPERFMLLTEEEYTDYFNVLLGTTDEYDKLPMKIQAYNTFGVVSEDMEYRMRDINKENYTKYKELIIRSIGGEDYISCLKKEEEVIEHEEDN